MPILGNHPEEIDITYTPQEARRRSEMRLHNARYGFFRVVKESIAPPVCEDCGKNIYGQTLKVDGRITHYHKCV